VRDKSPHDPTPVVIAYQWAARIISLAIEMVVPGLVGLWADNRLGTKVLFTLLGFGAGMTFAGWQLIKMTARLQRDRGDREPDTKREQRRP
jgi:hypothetical protein